MNAFGLPVPNLTTERMTMRCPRQSDVDAYIAFYKDPEASHFYGGPLNELGAWNVLAKAVGHWVLKGFGMWVLEDKQTKSVLGACGLVEPTGWPRPELTWWILPEARRQGFAKEASRAAINFGYDVLKWDMVQTHMNDENVAAKNLALSLGGKKIAREAFPDANSRDIFELPYQR